MMYSKLPRIKALPVLATSACMLMLLFGCGNAKGFDTNNITQSKSNSATESNTSTGESVWEKGISTTTLAGDAVTGDDFSRNTLTVLNVWATWCPPCVSEIPHLQEMNQKFSDKGLEVVGVLQDAVDENWNPVDGTIGTAKTLLDDAGADYRVILPDEVIGSTFISQMQYFPTTYFIDASGQVIKTEIGAHSAADWEEMINGVLEEIS